MFILIKTRDFLTNLIYCVLEQKIMNKIRAFQIGILLYMIEDRTTNIELECRTFQ